MLEFSWILYMWTSSICPWQHSWQPVHIISTLFICVLPSHFSSVIKMRILLKYVHMQADITIKPWAKARLLRKQNKQFKNQNAWKNTHANTHRINSCTNTTDQWINSKTTGKVMTLRKEKEEETFHHEHNTDCTALRMKSTITGPSERK